MRKHRAWVRWVLWVLLMALPVTALILHATRIYPTFFFDDSFISLRYADRFRRGLGLTWTDGERVEGYTNFLWVLIVGAIGFVSEGLINVARATGIVSTCGAILALGWLHAPRRWQDAPAALWGGFALAFSGPVAAWAIGGLEAPLLIGLVAWASALLIRDVNSVAPRPWRSWTAGVLLGLACLTRPDTPLLVAALCFGRLLGGGLKKHAWGAVLRVGLTAALFVCAHLLFRKLYYQAWIPNTASKLPTTTALFGAGWRYTTDAIELRFALLYPAGVAVIAFLVDRIARRRIVVILPALAAWTLYVVAIGGDFMPQKRHLVPSILFLALLGSETFAWIQARRGTLAGWWLVLVLPPWLWTQQQKDRAVPDANNSHWYWTGRPIGRFLREAFGSRNPVLAVDAAGSLPYFWRLRAIDMLGLNDRYLATHRRKEAQNAPLAHGLGDGKYMLARKPDLVVFHLPYGKKTPQWRGGQEMYSDPSFHKLYQLVRYRTKAIDVVEGMVWVRKEDGPLAVVRRADSISVPGYLLTSNAATRVEIGPQGRAAAVVLPNKAAVIQSLAVPPGTWCASAEGSGQLVAVIQTGAAATPDERCAVVPIDGSARVEVRLKSGEVGFIHGVGLQRSR